MKEHMSDDGRSSLIVRRHYGSICNRPTACAHNDWQAMTNPSITRSPTYCPGSPFCRVRSAANSISSTTRNPLKAQSASARARQRPGS